MRKSKFLNCVIVACLGIIVAGSTKYVSQKMCYAEADIYDGNYHDIAFDYDNDNDIFEETDLYTEEREKRNTTSAYIYIIIIRLQEYRQLELKQEIIQIVHMVHTRVVKLVKQSTY